MKGDCYIIGRPANIKSDFYYPYSDKRYQAQVSEVDENYRIELDPEFCQETDDDTQSW